jgi:hypothetical protein
MGWLTMSHGHLVKVENSQLSGCGFKSRHWILDGVSDLFTITLEKTAKWRTPKKKKNVIHWMVVSK